MKQDEEETSTLILFDVVHYLHACCGYSSMLIICNFIRVWWNHHYISRESHYDDYEYHIICRRLSPIAEYTQQYAIKFITAVGDEYMTILDTSWSIIGNVALFFTRYCHRVKGNKQHVGIDNTQQRRHLSVENAAEVAYECVQYAYEYNNQPRGIDWYPIDKSFLAERAFTTQQLSAIGER